MIRHFLQLIVSQLDGYIGTVSPPGTNPPFVVSGNIGLAPSLGGSEVYMDGMIVLSLVNMIEESTLKNNSSYRSASLNPEIENPPVFINLYLLFTANFNPPSAPGNDSQNYYRGITRLTHVIEFFQGKNVFSVSNSPTEELMPDTPLEDHGLVDMQNISIKMELVSLTFEQINYLWGSLGGKQMPFVLYKAKVISLTRRNLQGRGAPIQDIVTTSTGFTNTGS